MTTLATVREAPANGLAAKLAGDGALEEEEGDLLLPEIEELIERSGADALAEEFLRYERLSFTPLPICANLSAPEHFSLPFKGITSDLAAVFEQPSRMASSHIRAGVGMG